MNCTIVGFTSIGTILGAKMTHFGAFSGFPAKGRKVNPMTKSQLVVNPDFIVPTSQHKVPEVSRKRIPEVWSKVNFGQLRGSWSKSRRSQPCDSSPKDSKNQQRTMLDIMRSPIVYSFFLFPIGFYPFTLH